MTDDAKKVALLPCPFCGGQCAQLVIDQGYKWAHYEPSCLEVRTSYNVSEDAPWHTEAIAAWNTRQPQTDARVADLLFKLDVAATTFEKVTTSEHREAVFNAEHAKLLRDTIKVLRQPQTDALKVVREALEGLIDHCVEQERVITEEMHHMDYCGESAPICAARAALKESK
jgi:hypothetical protein